jgi:hypothetical protein
MVGFADLLELFRAAVAAVNAEDWDAAAALCDPVSLRAVHRQLLEQFAPREPHQPLTVDEYLRHSPEMPRAVAEYHVTQHQRLADPAERLRRALPGIVDAGALGALTPEQAFAVWLDGRSLHKVRYYGLWRPAAAPVRARLQRQLAAAGHTPFTAPASVPAPVPGGGDGVAASDADRCRACTVGHVHIVRHLARVRDGPATGVPP